MNIAENIDCMDGMGRYPDKYFDLAVVDLPYGGGCSQSVHVERERERERERELRGGFGPYKGRSCSRFGGWFDKYDIGLPDRRNVVKEVPGPNTAADIRHWDIAPRKDYFDELARVSKNQIIWGGNYFGLPPTRCFLIWDKVNISENFTMSMCEYAWTSFNDNAKMFRCTQQDGKRFHPTQKPVALYKWIFDRYAKEGYKILDTHLGSGSSRIAAYDAGLDFVGFEINERYFEKQEERFREHTAQMNLFLDF